MIPFDKKSIGKYAAGIAIALVIFGAGFAVGKYQAVFKVCQPSDIDMSLFWDAYNKLQEHFVDPAKIDTQNIIYGAISGMTKSLGDPFTAFFNPQQAKSFEQDLQGSFGGIGAEVGIKEDMLTIIAPLPGTPAEKAGLRAGDIIVKINGESTVDKTVEEAVRTIRGPKGTHVTLSIFREGFREAKDFVITRDTIVIKDMEWKLQEGGIAYIKISSFNQTLSANFKTAANQILNSGAQKIILDVRGNPGGYLETAQDIAGWFLQTGQIVITEDFGSDKESRVYKAEGNGSLSDYPLVVLIDKGSASASEILAGAVRDNRGVQLIGEQSFGKGSVQELISLADGQSFLKITIAKWLTPNGSSIAEVGLMPDVKITISDEDAAADKDTQLEKAIEIITGLQ